MSHSGTIKDAVQGNENQESFGKSISDKISTNVTAGDASIVEDNTKKNGATLASSLVRNIFEELSMNSTNYSWEDTNLDKIVACLASSYFLKFTYESRFLYVIIINPNFEIFESLLGIRDFNVYKEMLNKFLTNKLKEMKELKIDYNNFKYCGVQYKIKGEKSYTLSDFIISFDKFVLLDYKNSKFEVIKEINSSEIDTVIPNSKSKFFEIHTKKLTIKIKTVSFNSIAFLLEKIYKRLIDRP
jgi:hypothetical protein